MIALERFISTYQKLDKNNLSRLSSVYSSNIIFTDPLHEISGLDSLMNYFKSLYQNVDAVTFVFGETIAEQDRATITWVMTVRHPRLNGGQAFNVDGVSCLHFNTEGLVSAHRDYFDLGALLYEQIPLLKRIIKKIKERLTS